MMIEERKNTSVFSDSTDNDANDGDDNVISSSRGQGALFSLLLRERERETQYKGAHTVFINVFW